MNEFFWPAVVLLLTGIVAILTVMVLVRGQNKDTPMVLSRLEGLFQGLERSERVLREEIARNREEGSKAERAQRLELTGALEKLAAANETKLEAVRTTVERRLEKLQEDNAAKLEQMRQTVDEKLQGTLEKRLGESFKQVSERLEQVHQGLGEMQVLATGVGDLKKVLTNVKTRGTWGEVQLGALLEQVLHPEQYAANVATKGGGERVEYAVKLPGQGLDKSEVVYLPIDAKFPIEDYHRLLEAQDKADAASIEHYGRQLERNVRDCAKTISQKYLEPPKTTDFGIMFLPLEGLFAEVMRRPGIAEAVQRESRVVIAGPTTLWAILSSLQMGFRTLAIEKRSSEVWELLSAVKGEWFKYGEALDAVQKKLTQASESIEQVKVRSRAVGKKLRDVEQPTMEQALPLMAERQLESNGDEELT